MTARTAGNIHGSGADAGAAAIGCLDWDVSLSQRCNTLAFMPCALATAAMDAPGAPQAASNSALVSAE
jgi:hypothetical protein